MLLRRIPRKGDIEILGCFFIFILLIFALPFIFGGIGIKLMQDETKKLADQRQTMEGTIDKVESFNVEPPPEPPEDKERRGARITIKGPFFRERTKVTFKDGRAHEFHGPIPKPLEATKTYIIVYNGLNQVVEVHEK
jgi:hypothetical protein